jgi:predicted transcriptional regulator
MIISTKFSSESIYTLKLLLRNINVKGSAEVNILKSIKVEQIYTPKFEFVPEDMKFNDLIERMISSNRPYISVNDTSGNFIGIVSLNTVKEFLFDKDVLKDLMIAGDVADRNIQKVFLDDNGKSVFDKMGNCGFDGLPVVDSKDHSKQIGMIWRNDLDNAYHHELARMDLTSDLAHKILQSNIEKDVSISEGYAIAEVKAPQHFIGRSISEIGIRTNHGVDVLTIKTEKESGTEVKSVPRADYIITERDILIVAGEVRNINLLKSLG